MGALTLNFWGSASTRKRASSLDRRLAEDTKGWHSKLLAGARASGSATKLSQGSSSQSQGELSTTRGHETHTYPEPKRESDRKTLTPTKSKRTHSRKGNFKTLIGKPHLPLTDKITKSGRELVLWQSGWWLVYCSGWSFMSPFCQPPKNKNRERDSPKKHSWSYTFRPQKAATDSMNIMPDRQGYITTWIVKVTQTQDTNNNMAQNGMTERENEGEKTDRFSKSQRSDCSLRLHPRWGSSVAHNI